MITVSCALYDQWVTRLDRDKIIFAWEMETIFIVTYTPDMPTLLLTQPLISQVAGRYCIIYWKQMVEIIC